MANHADSFLLLNPEQKLATARFLQFIAMVDWIHGYDARTALHKDWAKWLEAKIHPKPNEQRN